MRVGASGRGAVGIGCVGESCSPAALSCGTLRSTTGSAGAVRRLLVADRIEAPLMRTGDRVIGVHRAAQFIDLLVVIDRRADDDDAMRYDRRAGRVIAAEFAVPPGAFADDDGAAIAE